MHKIYVTIFWITLLIPYQAATIPEYLKIFQEKTYLFFENSLHDYKKQNPKKYFVLMTYLQHNHISADINKLYQGTTLLHKAIAHKDFDQITLLLFLGADPNIANQTGTTAINLAQSIENPRYLNLLTKYSQKNAVDLSSPAYTSSWTAFFLNKIVGLIIPYKIDDGLVQLLNVLKSYKKQHPVISSLIFNMIRTHTLRIDEILNITIEKSILQHYVNLDSPDMCTLLLYLGANPLQPNIDGTSVFQYVVERKNMSYILLFWPYVSAPSLRAKNYEKIKSMRYLLLKEALMHYNATSSSLLLESIAQYFDIYPGYFDIFIDETRSDESVVASIVKNSKSILSPSEFKDLQNMLKK